MDLPKETRLFTIGEAVSQLQATYPNISHSSLRFLQREGMVNPLRTVGGHRLYTRGDLDRVRRIKRWQEHRLSLQEIRLRLEKMDALTSPAQISQRFLDLATHGDMDAAVHVVLHADELGLALARNFEEVLRPALVEVGERWAAGSLTVAQEHEISELTRDLVAELSSRHARPDPREPIVVAACVEDELHDLGLRMMVGVLRQGGARLHFLGANVSPLFLVEAVNQRRPDIVLLSVSLDDHLPALRDCVATLAALAARASTRPIVVAGGRGVAHAAGELEALGVHAIVDARLEAAAEAILTAWQPGS
ncbi:MAG: cobalamin-dependent protein [Chloroflexota bacterium]|nr:cobalamin-dependent protein [Chloroflexota bacterium]